MLVCIRAKNSGLCQSLSSPRSFFFCLEADGSFYLSTCRANDPARAKKPHPEQHSAHLAGGRGRHYAGISTGPSESPPGQQFPSFLRETKRKSQIPEGMAASGPPCSPGAALRLGKNPQKPENVGSDTGKSVRGHPELRHGAQGKKGSPAHLATRRWVTARCASSPQPPASSKPSGFVKHLQV